MNHITLEDVRRLAPAAFSNSPASTLSDSYSHVTTAKVLDALQQDGWLIKSAVQSRARKSSSLDHGRHEIALTHPQLPTHVEGSPLLRLSNSSDGFAALRTIGGFLRHACTNQLYAGIKVVGGVFHHRGGGLEDRVVAGARDLRANFDKVISRVDLWRSIELSPEQQLTLARAGLAARWGTNAPVFADLPGVLSPRRTGDDGRDLWSTFNRVQESLVRGGFGARFRTFDEEGNPTGVAERRVRRITGLAANQRLNTQLWDAADSLAVSLT
ncbi:MAG: DUF932 domain-containing protein [Ilumatobacteraceae bacterium]